MPIKGVISSSWAKQVVRAQSTNFCSAGTDANHSAMFTLLMELNVICAQRWTQFELQNCLSRAFVIAIHGKIAYTPIQQICKIGS